MSLGGKNFYTDYGSYEGIPRVEYNSSDMGKDLNTTTTNNRLVDPTLLAQQAILARDPIRYQPILTPENYQNFYDRYYTQPITQEPPIKDYKDRATQYKEEKLAREIFMPGGSDGGSESAGSEPSAWSQMSEAERAAWVQENPGAYIAGKTLVSAIMPGGAIIASMHDPYLDMSLADYHIAKASQAAMGGMLPEGEGAPIEVAQPIFDPNIYGYDYTSQPETTAPAAPAASASRSISNVVAPAPAINYGSINDFGGSSNSYAPTANEISISEAGGYTADVGGYDPTSGYDTDTDSGGDSGGSSKIVCTAMNRAYGFGSFRNRIWLAYSAKNLTVAHEKGYHALFLPLVDMAYRKQTLVSKPLRAVLENIARHRSADLRAEMRNQKRDLIGRAYRFVLEPLCYAVGKLKGY